MMNNQIHRINDIIKLVPALRYDCSTGVFETDRRALYDFAKLIIDECAHQAEIWDSEPLSGNSIAYEIKKHFEEKNT